MAQPEKNTEVKEGVRPKIERSFTSSRLEEELLAAAYETVVPLPRTVRAQDALERLHNMAAAIPAIHETLAMRG